MKLTETRYRGYLISNNKALLSLEKLREFLADTYWAGDRPAEIIQKSIINSECFGIYCENQQVGFARIVTDYSTMFWLCDVYVDREHRKKGLGKKLVEVIVTSDELEYLTGILGTRDAHALYEKYGFEKDGERFMRRRMKMKQ